MLMSIASKARAIQGASTNRPDYQASFLRDAHRLIARGYARLDPSLFSKTVEEVVTEELVVAITEAIEAPGAAAWMQRYHVVDDVRVRHPKKRGKKRPRVDIEITRTKPGRRPRLHFEAKRLGRRHAVGQYVGRKGLGCIIAADYAREHDDAGMLGYVQSQTCDTWATKIERKLRDNRHIHQLVAGSDWERSGLTPELSHIFRTQHNRPSLGRAVNVYHTLLLFC
jgi:hypothetical protein